MSAGQKEEHCKQKWIVATEIEYRSKEVVAVLGYSPDDSTSDEATAF